MRGYFWGRWSYVMRSKNSKSLTADERAHLERVKSLQCSLCGEPGPTDAHHIKQGQHWTCVALCKDCHGGPGYPFGWHGTRVLWNIRKWDELDALAVTIERLSR